MTVRHVQLRQIPSHRRTVQEIELGGVRVRIRATYNGRLDRWFASVYTLQGELILGSVACVPGVDLWRPYKHLDIPQGQLFCQSKDREPPTFATLDATARVLYRE